MNTNKRLTHQISQEDIISGAKNTHKKGNVKEDAIIQKTDEDVMVTVNDVLKYVLRLGKNEISRAKFLENGILLDGEPARISMPVKAGQTITVEIAAHADTQNIIPVPVPGHVSWDILYEDGDLLAVNKPAGIAVHPSHGHYADTMANYAAYYLGMNTAYIVGRLDKDTSGVLIFAKNRAAAGRLSRQRADGIFQRTYLALVKGYFDEDHISGTIRLAIGRDPASLMRQKVDRTDDESKEKIPDMKPAVTHYRVLASLEKECSLVCAKIDTGRTHQIRAHMAAVGHALLGDSLYGDTIQKDAQGNRMSRALLHAANVCLLQPFTGEKIVVEAALPEDMQAICGPYLQDVRIT